MTEVYVDPVLLAISDCLVLTALERAASRVLPRSVRMTERHRSHERCPIDAEKIDRALAGAWYLCPLLARRHELAVNVTRWQAVLDGYATALLMACEPHNPTRLLPHLAALAAPVPATRPHLAVAL